MVPLKAVDVRAKLVNFVADVEVLQSFVNDSDNPIEAVYVVAYFFDTYRFKFEQHNATLTNFTVEVDGKVYKGLCKDFQDAINDYDDAIASGHGAYLVEAGKKDNVIKVSVGNLPPRKECKLTLRYVTELETEEEYLRFVLPITRNVLLNEKEKGVRSSLKT